MINYDNAWLGLGDLSNLDIENPMIHRSKEDIETPDIHLMKIMRDTNYIGSTVKMLFGIELHPIQMAILLRKPILLITTDELEKSWFI